MQAASQESLFPGARLRAQLDRRRKRVIAAAVPPSELDRSAIKTPIHSLKLSLTAPLRH